MSVLTDFEGFFWNRGGVCAIFGRWEAVLSPFPIPFPPFFSHQKSFSFKNSVWVIGVPFCEWFWPWYWLLICLYRSVFRPDGFSSILKRRFWSSGGVFSLWGESVSLSELDSKRYALNINPQGRSTLAPLPFCYSNIRTTTTTTIELTSTTSNLTKYLTKQKFLRRISEKNSRFFRKFLLKNENQWFLISLKIADFRRKIDILGVSRKNVLFCIEYHFFNDSFFETKIT